jgi:hypothetical protein
MSRRAIGILLVVLSTLGLATIARGEVTQSGSVRVSVSAKLQPHRLPRRGTSPVAVSFGGRISTTDGALPPRLESLQIDINRYGRFDHEGLPTCDVKLIKSASSSRALEACRDALVGQGKFSASVQLAGQEPYPAAGRLLVFNGRRHGRPVLFGHMYSPRPFATSFVIPFSIRHLPHGRYGTELTARFPKAMGGWGTVTGIEMKLSRRYSSGGRRHSFLSAGCPAPEGMPGAAFVLARTSFLFAGGKKLSTGLSRSCEVRG